MKPTEEEIEALRNLERSADELLAEIAASAQSASRQMLEDLEHIAGAAAKIAYGTGNPELISEQMHNLIAWTDHLDNSVWASRFQQALNERPLVNPFLAGVFAEVIEDAKKEAADGGITEFHPPDSEDPRPDKVSKLTSPKAKMIISLGIAIVMLISILMGITSNPLNGIAVFFILTVLLWAMAKTRHWI